MVLLTNNYMEFLIQGVSGNRMLAKEVATYFHRKASTLNRHIGKIDTKVKSSDRLRAEFNGYINTIMHA